MKRIIIFVVVLVASSLSAAAQALGTGATAPVKVFLDAFNKGDLNAMAAAMEPDTVIMDEVPPHLWRGTGAVKAWLASLDAYDKAHGRSAGAVELGSSRVTTTASDRGYAVVPAGYTFKEKGKPMREAATITFALHRYGSTWKIDGWSWNGTVPAAGR